MNGVFLTGFIKRGGKVVYEKKSDEILFKQFCDLIKEGERIYVIFDASGTHGALTQLAKVNICIRKLAAFTGASFEAIKLAIKHDTGFCIQGECKSFGDMGKEELDMVMETIIQKGELVGINLR